MASDITTPFTQLALNPIIDVLRLDRFQGSLDRIGGLFEDDGAKRKQHRGHSPFAVCALQAFVFADQRFDHLATSRQPFVFVSLGGLLADECQ